MPVISMFYGLIVSMYYLDTNSTNYLTSMLDMERMKVFTEYQEELMADWELAVSGNKVFLIDPLK